MKRKLICCIFSTMLFSTSAISSGIPVVDAVGNLQEMTHWLERVKQWEQTVVHYKDQLQAYKDQLATATGLRDIQALVGQSKNLANDLKNLRKQGISLNDLLNNPGGAYTSQLDSLYSKYKVFDSCDTSGSTSYLDACKQQVLNQAVSIEETTEVENKISEVLSDISTLTDRIQLSKDSKESQDLANVVSARSVQLNVLTSQWEMSVRQAELRTKMLQQKREKARIEYLKKAPLTDLNNL
ncbi:type IV secretion system protein VirB5 [Salmonella enterica subsp. enterica serovar Heidelberg]|nr:type IV secretion system protein VirB5 [Salmonella enterica subsp. enterica serovar Heidelberg]EDQ2103594.1 type IV secretion system protein VirB5 [Salmonella enterica subsp. enterica serovar Heidelberg]